MKRSRSSKPEPGRADVFFYYRFQGGHPAINIRNRKGVRTKRRLQRESLYPDQSVLAQRKDPGSVPGGHMGGKKLRGYADLS